MDLNPEESPDHFIELCKEDLSLLGVQLVSPLTVIVQPYHHVALGLAAALNHHGEERVQEIVYLGLQLGVGRVAEEAAVDHDPVDDHEQAIDTKCVLHIRRFNFTFKFKLY